MRYISRGAISPARADLLLVDDRLIFFKLKRGDGAWWGVKNTHLRERNLSSMMAPIYLKQAL